MKLFRKLLQPIIQSLVQEEIQRMMEVNPPLIKELKIANIKNGKSITVWDALLSNPISISFCVRYIDDNGLEDFKSYECDDLSNLKRLLLTFKPEYNQFVSVSLHVKPRGSSQSIVHNIVYADKGQIYNIEELDKIKKPVLEWINKYPEELI